MRMGDQPGEPARRGRAPAPSAPAPARRPEPEPQNPFAQAFAKLKRPEPGR
jgi:hypothetical protein